MIAIMGSASSIDVVEVVQIFVVAMTGVLSLVGVTGYDVDPWHTWKIPCTSRPLSTFAERGPLPRTNSAQGYTSPGPSRVSLVFRSRRGQ